MGDLGSVLKRLWLEAKEVQAGIATIKRMVEGKSGGCEYCLNGEDLLPYGKNGFADGLCAAIGELCNGMHEIIIANEKTEFTAKLEIHFCPMCGRVLQ